MMLATDDIGMSILMNPALAYSVPNNDPPHGNEDDPVGFSKCYHEFNKAVRQSRPTSAGLHLNFSFNLAC